MASGMAKAYRQWLQMPEPSGAVDFPPLDYQDAYCAAPKQDSDHKAWMR